jgi:hypothetical protein
MDYADVPAVLAAEFILKNNTLMFCIYISLGFVVVAASPAGPITLVSTGGQKQDARQRKIEEAKGVAEVETGGEAVAARWVSLGGTYSSDGLGGIEVLVHMSGKTKGWRCIIDSNNMKLRRKEAIPNPASKVRSASIGLTPYHRDAASLRALVGRRPDGA